MVDNHLALLFISHLVHKHLEKKKKVQLFSENRLVKH